MTKGKYKYLPLINYFFIVLPFLIIFLCGCGVHSAVKRTENYTYAWPNINYMSNKNIEISIIDKRSYVLNGKVNPTYVGLMRGGFYNPWYMNTESGKPLAEDLSQAVVAGFKNAGINAELIKLPLKINNQEGKNYIFLKNSAKKVLIIINEWQSDTFANTAFLYDITATIYNEEGVMVAECKENNLNETGENQTVVSPVDAGRNILTKVLNNQKIMSALQ